MRDSGPLVADVAGRDIQLGPTGAMNLRKAPHGTRYSGRLAKSPWKERSIESRIIDNDLPATNDLHHPRHHFFQGGLIADHIVADPVHVSRLPGDLPLRVDQLIHQCLTSCVDNPNFNDAITVGRAKPSRFGVKEDRHPQSPRLQVCTLGSRCVQLIL